MPVTRTAFIYGVGVSYADMITEQTANRQQIGVGLAASQGTPHAVPGPGYQPLSVVTNGTMQVSLTGSVALINSLICDACQPQSFTVPAPPQSGMRQDLICVAPLTYPIGTITRSVENADGTINPNVQENITNDGAAYSYIQGPPDGTLPQIPAGVFPFAQIAVAAGATSINDQQVTILFPTMTPQGPQGIQGIQGIQGTPGTKGDQGNPGLNSTVPGPKGDKGDPGPQGNPGRDGANSTVAGPPGRDSTVAGPKGDTGAQGPSGGLGTHFEVYAGVVEPTTELSLGFALPGLTGHYNIKATWTGNFQGGSVTLTGSGASWQGPNNAPNNSHDSQAQTYIDLIGIAVPGQVPRVTISFPGSTGLGPNYVGVLILTASKVTA